MPLAGKRLLLISNSTMHGRGFLDHAEKTIRSFLDGAGRVLFVPYALADRDAYAARARKRFETMGYACEAIHRAKRPREAIAQAQALFVGGGNTFRLLKTLQEEGLLLPIGLRAAAGMPYIGSSAGSVIAAPTIRTTNDMPIVEPPSLEALGLVPFQINAHYLDPDPASTHMGETREERLRQFHEENAAPVVGLREGAMLSIGNGTVLLQGSAGARVFRRGESSVEAAPGASLGELLA